LERLGVRIAFSRGCIAWHARTMNLKKCTVRYLYIRALYGGSLGRDRIPGLERYPDRLQKSIVDSNAAKNNSFKTICRCFVSIL
jgi:hypothetical protein